VLGRPLCVAARAVSTFAAPVWTRDQRGEGADSTILTRA
jgi:hypothetical protein